MALAAMDQTEEHVTMSHPGMIKLVYTVIMLGCVAYPRLLNKLYRGRQECTLLPLASKRSRINQSSFVGCLLCIV